MTDNNILKLASSKDGDEGVNYKLTIQYKDKDLEPGIFECNFFGVSIETPNFLLIGKESEKSFIPIALIDNNSIWKIDIEVI